MTQPRAERGVTRTRIVSLERRTREQLARAVMKPKKAKQGRK